MLLGFILTKCKDEMREHLFGMLGLLLILTFSADAVSAQSDPVEMVRNYRQMHGAEILSGFAELLAIPNVASDSAGIHRNAD